MKSGDYARVHSGGAKRVSSSLNNCSNCERATSEQDVNFRLRPGYTQLLGTYLEEISWVHFATLAFAHAGGKSYWTYPHTLIILIVFYKSHQY
jgi:hypothetical protein